MPYTELRVRFLLLFFVSIEAFAFQAKVIRVYSGDSLQVETEDKKKFRIHLAGIDAPEAPKGILTGQPYGVQAKNELNKIALGSRVEVLIEGSHEEEGYYAILLAQSGICLNCYMAESGLAVLTGIRDRYYEKLLTESYDLALRNRWNMWSQKTVESPAEYRMRTKRKHLD